MIGRAQLALTVVGIAIIGTAWAGWSSIAEAQGSSAFATTQEARAELDRAQTQAREAAARAEKLTEQAGIAERTADRSAQEAAALAARIQESESTIAASEARLALITDQRRVLDARLAERREPIVRLAAALQNMARRPLALSALRPGSLKDAVYVRATLEAAVPEVQKRTASLRSELAQGARLEAQAEQVLREQQEQGVALRQRRQALSAMEQRQRRASREASGVAVRENERALAFAEQARDLNDLVGQLDEASQLRRELAALPGPIIRPPRPGASEVPPASAPAPQPSSTSPPANFQLPVNGRIVLGFGASGSGGSTSEGLTLAPAEGAQVVSPAAGRVAFAGPYRGFGLIVIVEHPNGWTSLITGLATTSVGVGDNLVSGGPLGNASASDPSITLELRRDGDPVNPLEYMD